MPRIPYAQEGSEAPGATPVYREFKKGFGMVPNIVKLTGHSGAVTQALGGMIDTLFNKLNIPPQVREVAYLTVAKTNECGYCAGHHVLAARRAGLSEEKIAACGLGASLAPALSEAERAVARFAFETTEEVKASDAAFAELKKHFSDAQIVEIAFVAAAGNFIQRIGKNFGVELEM